MAKYCQWCGKKLGIFHNEQVCFEKKMLESAKGNHSNEIYDGNTGKLIGRQYDDDRQGYARKANDEEE